MWIGTKLYQKLTGLAVLALKTAEGANFFIYSDSGYI